MSLIIDGGKRVATGECITCGAVAVEKRQRQCICCGGPIAIFDGQEYRPGRPKLSEVFDHPDDVVNAIEAWVKGEAEVGLMVAYDARRVQEAGRILKQRIDDAWLGRPNEFNKGELSNKENKNASY